MANCKSWVAVEAIRTGLAARLNGSGYMPKAATVLYGPLQQGMLGDLPAVIVVPASSDLSLGSAKRHLRKMRVMLHVVAEAQSNQGVLQALMNTMADVERALDADEQLVTALDENGQRVTNGGIEFRSEGLNPELSEFFGKATATIEVMVPLWWDHTTA